MKLYLSIAAGAVIVVLAVVLFMTKRSDTAQLASATDTIVDFSNRLDTAHAQIANRDESLVTLSNSLAECQSASLTFSNQLTEAQATNALQADQITGLNGQVTAAAAENQALNGRITDLTNQVVALNGRLAVTETNLAQTRLDLAQAQKDYALLGNRLRRDVAERVVVERRFNNLGEVQAQEEKLKKAGAPWVTSGSIYAGLDVEVQSNGVVHVLAPN
jgi:chromosome segregation ATPase